VRAELTSFYVPLKEGNSVWVSGTVSYDAASKTVTFTPSSLLAKGTYEATINGYGEPPRVEDKADNVLRGGYAYAWSFSTSGTLCCGK
jgi:hypothetical protein